LDYIKRRQKQWQKKWQREAELEAKKEAERVAIMEAEARKQEEIVARKKLLLEQQETERVRQKHIQAKEKLTEDKWNEQLDTLLAQVDRRRRENDKLEEIRIIIQNREPSLQDLGWASWLSDPLNQRLADLDYEYAMEMFKRDNLMAKRRHGTRGHGRTASNVLSFTGDTNSETRKGDLVATQFNPDDPDGSGKPLAESGFTISYWVRPDELGGDMFCIGRKAHNNERFTFGISNKKKGYFSIGGNQSERLWETMLDTAGMDKAAHLELDDSDWILKTDGTWYHFAVTYAGTDAGTDNMLRKIYMNGQQIWGTGVSDPTYKGNISWSNTGREMSKGMSFGMRAIRGSGTNTNYNNGWACALSEVAIFNTEKDADWVENVYNNNGPLRPRDRRARNKNIDFRDQIDLVGYWKFNEGSGTTVTDHSGNGNHGTLTNDTYGDDGGAAWVDADSLPTWDSSPFSNS